jgi:hypothetical protein
VVGYTLTVKELFSTTRNLHHLLILLCFALLPTVLRVDEKGHLELAQEELRALSSYHSAELDGEFSTTEKARGRKWVDQIIPIDVRQSPGFKNTQWTFRFPIAYELPDRASTLKTWGRYFRPPTRRRLPKKWRRQSQPSPSV